MFSEDQRQTLLRIARNAIARELGLVPAAVPLPAGEAALSTPAGVFVTLRLAGDLRGCIGYVEAEEPVRETVDQVAVRAAFNDPRFAPLSLSEFRRVTIEISVLSPLRLVKDIREIEAGVHGLVNDGDQVRVDIKGATVENLTTGKRLQGTAPSRFLLGMLEAGGLIPLLKSGAFPGTATR